MAATTLRARFDAYLAARDIPETPEWYDGAPTSTRLVGTAVVIVVGWLAASILTTPVILGVAAVAGVPVTAPVVMIPLAILTLAVANQTALYLGGPVADTVIGVPREVPG